MATLSAGVALAASPVAYVFVQEDSSQTGDTAPSPISVYAAASNGKVTKIKGSPFKQIAGVMFANNAKHIVTLDAGYLHSYAVSSEGVIGARIGDKHPALLRYWVCVSTTLPVGTVDLHKDGTHGRVPVHDYEWYEFVWDAGAGVFGSPNL
jgi:hypothetical protein